MFLLYLYKKASASGYPATTKMNINNHKALLLNSSQVLRPVKLYSLELAFFLSPSKRFIIYFRARAHA